MQPSTSKLVFAAATLLAAALPAHAQIAGRWEPPGGREPEEHVAFVDHARWLTDLHERLGWTEWPAEDELAGADMARLRRETTELAVARKQLVLRLEPGVGDHLGPVVGANFEVDFSFAIAEGGNSGLKYRIPVEGDDRRGPEYQILDDRAFPKLSTKHRCGALYDVVEQATPVAHRTWGGFVHHAGRIVARDARLYHECDGVPTARALVGSEGWQELVQDSKFSGIAERFGRPAPGHLLFQDHGAPVRFGHVFLRDLDGLPGERLELYDGESLAGWKLVGDASYTPTPDGIVGTITNGKRNAFLTTERTFGDFVLELEMKLGAKGNSGVQIRSRVDGARLRGYQVEIDPSDRAWSGGLYDEARRGWLQNLAENAAGRAALDLDGWNRYRIECVGPWIRTWVNDVPIVDRLDGLDLEGHLGLQVHSGKEAQITWRNLVLHDLGRHRWTAAEEGFWRDGSFQGDRAGLLWSPEKVGDGSWRVRFTETPTDLRLFVAVRDRGKVFDPRVSAPAFEGTDDDGTTWGESALGHHARSGGVVVKLADHLESLKPVAGHENTLDVMRHGNRLAVTFGGRPLFASHDVRGLHALGWLGLMGVDAKTIASTEMLVAD